MYQNIILPRTKTNLVGYDWKVAEAKAVVCLVHGIGEHAGRYDRVGEVFRKNEIALVSMDLRGHGMSPGTRGHAAPRCAILQDINRLIEYAQKQYPNTPLVLYGHSLGGNIVLDYRRRGKYRLLPDSYLVTSPWIVIQRKISKSLYHLAGMIAKVKPDFQMKTKINPTVLGNQEVIHQQGNTELLHDKISVQTALDGFSIANSLLQNILPIQGDNIVKKMLLMHGGGDQVCLPAGSRMIATLEKESCEYQEWDGLFHEIHNGSSNSKGDEVIESMVDWIKKSF